MKYLKIITKLKNLEIYAKTTTGSKNKFQIEIKDFLGDKLEKTLFQEKKQERMEDLAKHPWLASPV
jgi:hypothetical protein